MSKLNVFKNNFLFRFGHFPASQLSISGIDWACPNSEWQMGEGELTIFLLVQHWQKCNFGDTYTFLSCLLHSKLYLTFFFHSATTGGVTLGQIFSLNTKDLDIFQNNPPPQGRVHRQSGYGLFSICSRSLVSHNLL